MPIKKPKPLGKSYTHFKIAADGSRWLTTQKPGTKLPPGERWRREVRYEFQMFHSKEDGTYVIQDCAPKDLTAEKARKIAKFYLSVAKYIDSKNKKARAE